MDTIAVGQGKTEVAQPVVPTVGMGITLHIGTDRYACTIVSVSASGKSFKATKDTAIRVDSNGMSEDQDYAYTSNPEGEQISFRLNKTGRYKSNMGVASLGVRRHYHDFTF